MWIKTSISVLLTREDSERHWKISKSRKHIIVDPESQSDLLQEFDLYLQAGLFLTKKLTCLISAKKKFIRKIL